MENCMKKTTEQKSYVKTGFSRLVFAAIAVLIEFLWIYGILLAVGKNYAGVSSLASLVALIIVIFLYGREMNASLKMPWIILISAFPPLGIMLYLFVGLSGSTKRMRERFETIDSILFQLIPQNQEVMDDLHKEDSLAYTQAMYLSDFCKFPIYKDTRTEFYNEGHKGLEAQKEALRKAEKFIFMEYHAIEDKEAFHELEDILVEKVQEGVEVRLFYDDMGSIFFINMDFIKRMEEKGIQCRCFNPVVPIANMFLNNRDHRKITIIDGKVGFTGGYNLANEYFGYTEPFGKWKDTGIKLEGEAVRSLTIMFLEMWNAIHATDKDDKEYDYYFPQTKSFENQGYVQPYADSPLDHEHVGENVYLNLINSATDYLYFVTPYLIITDEMDKAFRLAAKKGVDVRIITPGIPDKKLVYSITRSYYSRLCRHGVRIFEYTPGFCHAKMSVADGKYATCGTINLDYRSLYHHFENGVFMYNTPVVADIKKDFDDMFPVCHEVTDIYRAPQKKRLLFSQCILRLFAPLL